MCGIGALYESSSSGKWNEDKVREALKCIANRGPDENETTYVRKNMVLLASVLHLRGIKCMKQPFSMKDSRDILLWNGEVFGGRPVVTEKQSDTKRVFEVLSSETADSSRKDVGVRILKTLDMIEGPWAAVYWHHKTQSLWFGRDRLGRRSLLLRFEREEENVLKSLRISSVLPASEHNKYVVPADKDQYKLVDSVWQAIPPTGLFGVCFDEEDNLCGFEHIPRRSSLSSTSSTSSSPLPVRLERI